MVAIAIGLKRNCFRSTNIHGFSKPATSGIAATISTIPSIAASSKYHDATGASAAVTTQSTAPRQTSTRNAAPRKRGSSARDDCTTAWSIPR